MQNTQPAGITVIPTAAFFATPALYGIALGLQAVFPGFGEQFLPEVVFLVLPCLLLLSLLISVMRLLASPLRTWTLGFAVVLNLVTTVLALSFTWLLVAFPQPN